MFWYLYTGLINGGLKKLRINKESYEENEGQRLHFFYQFLGYNLINSV